ncbi:CD82 antigen-like [Haliotis rubra]|uniref:CD82 antigen-like n=1 Tax=Haliotis rubra TaxID=36100 RepID=UPI001EE58FDD|nr:CD82 antigen-like [Haliotis rubra]
MGCGDCLAGCARVLLIVFNFIFWLSGAAILGIGIWFLVDPNISSYLDVIQVKGEGELLKYAAYIFIAFGAFVFAVGFCGCCGAIRNSQCLLGFYIFFLVVVFAGELAAGILVALYRGDLETKLEAELKRKIKEEYDYANRSSVGDAIDKVQMELKCCGGSNSSDYNKSNWSTATKLVYPESCCTKDANNNIADLSQCQAGTGSYNKRGCKDKLIEWMKQHSTIIIGVGCGIAGIQIIGLVFAIALCRQIRSEEKC